MSETKDTELVQISKSDLEAMKASIEALSGLKSVVEQQNELLKNQQAKANEQAKQIESLTSAVAEANSRAENAVNATKEYVRPATIINGEREFLSFEVSVLYKQGSTTGVVTEKEVKFDIEMPQPCGHLNSIDSELRGRIIPQLMAQKGITHYLITGIVFDSTKIKSAKKKVSFVGKKPLEFTAEDCQLFAIIYEGLRIPTSGDMMTLRNAVANEWAYIVANVQPNRPLIINGRPANKLEQTVELVDYKGVRQDMPALEAVSPSKFRELAEEEPQK